MSELRDRMFWMVGGYRVTQMVRAAAELGICDAVAAGPRSAADLAPELGSQPELLYRLMRGLAGVGILREAPAGHFANTDLGELLRADSAGSMRQLALALPDLPSWRAWAELTRSVQDGSLPYEVANGATFWEMNAADTALGERFNQFMVAQTEVFVPQLLEAFDFAGSGHVVDVGGGNGALIAGLLAAHPQLKGTLFDLREGLQGADSYLSSRGVRDRCELVEGDFFKSIPGGGDVYLLKMILHDWNDSNAQTILDRCRAAMKPGARLMVIDALLPEIAGEGVRERFALMLDLHMHVLFGARERTEAELRRMLERAGFRVAAVVATAPPSTVVAEAIG